MPSTGNPRVDAAVSNVAAALADWTRSVEAITAEIREQLLTAGGDPDGPEATERLRTAIAAARADLPEPSREAFDWLMSGLRTTARQRGRA